MFKTETKLIPIDSQWLGLRNFGILSFLETRVQLFLMSFVGTIVELPVVGYGLVLREMETSILLAKLVQGRGVEIGYGEIRLPKDFVLVTAMSTQMRHLGKTRLSIEIAVGLARSKSKRPHKAVSIQSNMSLQTIEKRVHSKTAWCPVLFVAGAIVRGYVADALIHGLVLKQDGGSLICVHLVEKARVPVWESFGILEQNVVGILLRTATQVAVTALSTKIAKDILRANGDSKKTAQPECANCSAEGTLSFCGRCNLVMYCSKACQRQHWTSLHKAACAAVGQRGPTELPPRPAGDLCPVCIEPLNTAFAMPCGHKVHEACRDMYFKISGVAKCAFCRK